MSNTDNIVDSAEKPEAVSEDHVDTVALVSEAAAEQPLPVADKPVRVTSTVVDPIEGVVAKVVTESVPLESKPARKAKASTPPKFKDGKVAEIAESAEELKDDVAEKVSDIRDDVSEKASDTADKVRKTAEEIAGKAREAVKDAQTRAKAALEKNKVALSDASAFVKGNFEAVVESGKILVSGVKVIGKTYVEDTKSNFGTFKVDVQEFRGIKSPKDFVKLQGTILRKYIDGAAARNSKNGEAVLKLANEAIQPISNRVSLVREKIKKAA